MPPKKSLCQRMILTVTRHTVSNAIAAYLWKSESCKEVSILAKSEEKACRNMLSVGFAICHRPASIARYAKTSASWNAYYRQ